MTTQSAFSSVLFLLISVCASAGALAEDTHGKMTRLEFEKEHYEWLEARQEKAGKEIKSADPRMRKFAKDIASADVEVFYGPWCEDSREHLPVFMALLQAVRATPKSLTFYSLDRHRTYPGYRNERNIEKLPTFVFRRNGAELGRIVETPKKSVLDDSLAILARRPKASPGLPKL